MRAGLWADYLGRFTSKPLGDVDQHEFIQTQMCRAGEDFLSFACLQLWCYARGSSLQPLAALMTSDTRPGNSRAAFLWKRRLILKDHWKIPFGYFGGLIQKYWANIYPLDEVNDYILILFSFAKPQILPGKEQCQKLDILQGFLRAFHVKSGYRLWK